MKNEKLIDKIRFVYFDKNNNNKQQNAVLYSLTIDITLYYYILKLLYCEIGLPFVFYDLPYSKNL